MDAEATLAPRRPLPLLAVNVDGSLSRIHNWATMDEEERARTARVILARNEKRLKVLREAPPKDDAPGEAALPIEDAPR